MWIEGVHYKLFLVPIQLHVHNKLVVYNIYMDKSAIWD